MNDKTKVLIICGATASGKSSASIDIAEKINGEIISADSMQIYRGLDIGTAKITEKGKHGINHYMIDVVNPKDNYSVSEYTADAIKSIDSIINNGHIPIICGGTGLYIDGILYEYAYGKCGSDDALRESLGKKYDTDDGESLYNEMFQLDKEDTVKYHKNNKHRLIRAWEIYLLSGKTKSQLSQDKIARYDAEIIVINRERAELYQRIDTRVDQMFECGIENEIENLLKSGVGFDCQSMQAIGYKEFKPFFDGEITLDEVKNLIKLNTRHYAKRQITWFKQYKNASWLEPSEAVKYAVEKFIEVNNSEI